MDSAAHPWQAVVKVQQRRRSRCNQRRIQIFKAHLIVEQHLFNRMQSPSPPAYDIRRINPLLHLLEHAVLPAVGRNKGEPCGVGQTVRNFGKPFQPDFQIILLIRQNVIDLNASESRMVFRGKGDAAAVAPERFVDVGLEPFELLFLCFCRQVGFCEVADRPLRIGQTQILMTEPLVIIPIKCLIREESGILEPESVGLQIDRVRGGGLRIEFQAENLFSNASSPVRFRLR